MRHSQDEVEKFMERDFCIPKLADALDENKEVVIPKGDDREVDLADARGEKQND